MNLVKILEERGRGTRGGSYVYVVEGNELVHIGEYAISKLPGKYEDEVIYEVPANRVSGEVLYCFNFSRRDGSYICKCRIEDFENGYPKSYEYFETLRERISEIKNLRFRVNNPKLKSLLLQFNQLFVPMINEVKEYEKIKNVDIGFMGHQARLRDVFSDTTLYYFTFMSIPSDKGRSNSLRITRRWVYQLWILTLICDGLQVGRFKKHVYGGKPYWWIEQGSDVSTCIGETPFGDITFWLEFQTSKGAHLAGLFARERLPVRPDIVLARGSFSRTEEFLNSNQPIQMLVECKEDPFEEWGRDIEHQIIPYYNYFRPKHFILVSLEHVSEAVKKDLEKLGIRVVDNVKPNSDAIEKLKNFVWAAIRK